MKYYIMDERYFPTPNTAEYGFGDYRKSETYVRAEVEAESEREAQKLAKRIDKTIRFSGINGCWITKEKI